MNYVNKIKTLSKRSLPVLLIAALVFDMSAFSVFAGSKKTSSSSVFTISSREDFSRFIEKTRSDPSLDAKLTGDIVLNDKDAFEGQNNLFTFEAVYGGSAKDKIPYSGDFDGQGHSITGYVSCENLPVFYIIDRAGRVHDLKIETSVFSPTYNTSEVDDTEYCASLAEVNYGSIENCEVDASVLSRGLCAGIAGVNESSGTIKNTSFKGKVTGGIGIKTAASPDMEYAFDIVVINNGKIENCTSDAQVKSVAGLSVPYSLIPAKDDSNDKDNKAENGSKAVSDSASKNGAKKNIVRSVSENGLRTVSQNAKAGYIGPEVDTVVKLVKGDTLWHLSRVYYGAGIKYKNMKLRDKNGKFGGLENHVLTRLPIGMEVFIPRLTETGQ